MPDNPAKIIVRRPAGCDRRALAIDALDRHTKDLAIGTTIEIDDGRPIYCLSFKTRRLADGTELLCLEIGPECFEITNEEKS